jgi:hypothetical protein
MITEILLVLGACVICGVFGGIIGFGMACLFGED